MPLVARSLQRRAAAARRRRRVDVRAEGEQERGEWERAAFRGGLDGRAALVAGYGAAVDMAICAGGEEEADKGDVCFF